MVRSGLLAALLLLGTADVVYVNAFVAPRVVASSAPAPAKATLGFSVPKFAATAPRHRPTVSDETVGDQAPPPARGDTVARRESKAPPPASTPAQTVAPSPKPSPASRADRAAARTVTIAFYRTGQAALSARARRELADVARTMRDDPQLSVDVVGHTDARGNDGVNDRLSLRRAMSVRRALVHLGVVSTRIRIEGAGDDDPAVRGRGPRAWAKNRRAELVLRSGGK